MRYRKEPPFMSAILIFLIIIIPKALYLAVIWGVIIGVCFVSDKRRVYNGNK